MTCFKAKDELTSTWIIASVWKFNKFPQSKLFYKTTGWQQLTRLLAADDQSQEKEHLRYKIICRNMTTKD